MNEPGVFFGATHAGASVLLLARVATAEGELIAPADVGAASYTVYRLQPCGVPNRTPVTGHEQAALNPAAVLYSTPQLAVPWTADAVGYNFRHEIDVTVAAAFSDPGEEYLVRYELTPVIGQPIVFTFRIEAI